MRLNFTHKKHLELMDFDSMSKFRNRGIEIYRSSNIKRTSRYFGDSDKNECFWELVAFNYDYGEPRYFIQLPYYDYYIELIDCGTSAHGSMEKISLLSPISDTINPFYIDNKKISTKLELMKFNEDLCIIFSLDFDFLKRVARKNYPIYKYDLDNENFGDEIVDKVLSKKYIKIPDYREITYSYVTKDNNYIIVDQSKYNFDYDTMRCWFGNFNSGIKEVKIENFYRYRDGGTTGFDFMFNEQKYTFYSPSNLGLTNKKISTINGIELVEMSDDLKEMFINNIKINIEK